MRRLIVAGVPWVLPQVLPVQVARVGAHSREVQAVPAVHIIISSAS